ncbi:MAG: phage major capsid protein [Pseudomonadota bacterium]
MALTFNELQAITNDYFMLDSKKAVDIYFSSSYLMWQFMDKKKGIMERPSGGQRYRIPLEYDGQEGAFYSRGETLTSDSREILNAAYFWPKHAYGNATIYRSDEQEASGEYAEVQLVQQHLAAAQKTCRKVIAQNIYGNNADTAKEITGLTKACLGAATLAYGGLIENDLVSTDLTKHWSAKNTTTTEGISLAVLRTLRTSAKISDGAGGKPDTGITTEALFNIVSGILQVQQRFTEDKDTVKAGFTNLVFEGMTIAADDFNTAGYFFALNSKHYGWAIHKDGFFQRTPWGDLTNAPSGVAGKTMKIFWDGNQVVNNRKAHALHTNLS